MRVTEPRADSGSSTGSTVAERILQVRQIITETEAASGRSPGAVRLLAVSKGRSWRQVQHAMDAGIGDFGENYAQEAAARVDAVAAAACKAPCWHFIGSLQSNKLKLIANSFAWVHSVDRLKIARLLSAQRSTAQSPLNICLQLNIDDDPAKSGVTPGELRPLAEEVLALPGLRLRGLMTMPAEAGNRRDAFARTRACMEKLCSDLSISMDTLSMGTSSDYVDAIREGATIVRLGKALFGTAPAEGADKLVSSANTVGAR